MPESSRHVLPGADRDLAMLVDGAPAPARLEVEENFRRSWEKYRAHFTAAAGDNTDRALISGLRYFWAWAYLAAGLTRIEYPVPAAVIEKFVTDHLTSLDEQVERSLINLKIKSRPGPLKLSSVRSRLWALSRAHQDSCPDLPEHYVLTPRVRSILKRASKDLRHAPKKAEPMDRELLLRVLDGLEAEHPRRAILLRSVLTTAFAAGGLRRSEICGLAVHDLARHPVDEEPGFRFEIALRQSKTRSAAAGPELLPVRGSAALFLQDWLELRSQLDVRSDRLFLSIRKEGTVVGPMTESWLYRAIKACTARIGLDPGLFSPHSLRGGYSTTAHLDGIPLKEAMEMSRHSSERVHLSYIKGRERMNGPAGNLLDNTSTS